ncbi:MAG: sigma-70 family RNA polymerase sigma factor [Pirellulaceae bacterium]|nr:sigma-70 family RNA polymerase sigma factor [Pirellulaceae bacterium]
MSDIADEDWVKLLQGPEPERGQAIERLRSSLLRALSHSLPQRYGLSFQAEDIVQDALLKVLTSLDSFKGHSRFLTWAVVIATRVGISAVRRKYTKDISLDAIQAADRLRFERSSEARQAADDLVDQRQYLIDQLNALIESSLSDRQRLAMRGALEGIPVDELADRLSSNRNAVYKLLHDGRLKLKAALERQGITTEMVQTTLGMSPRTIGDFR